ncbi:hypothetical protein K438DRAFT_1881208, partial [Mycena galopus ATCC 62051]
MYNNAIPLFRALFAPLRILPAWRAVRKLTGRKPGERSRRSDSASPPRWRQRPHRCRRACIFSQAWRIPRVSPLSPFCFTFTLAGRAFALGFLSFERIGFLGS